ncbi:MAG: hypothetical protein K9H49_16505 [Bacteroidales bacterium]|nr:hypothetical protein [Bacteroidales bacterium]MCF8391780.1 hypothetical protein [Bacteroidales bacterium]
MEDFLKRVIEGNGIIPSDLLIQSLHTNFENSVNVEWSVKGDYFEAIFYKDKLEYIAIFHRDGTLLEYRIFLPKGYLPEKLKKIAESKGEIMNSIMRNTGNSVEYEIIIRNEDLIRYLIRLSDIGVLIEEKKL